MNTRKAQRTKQTFKPGDRVAIINQTLAGRLIVEGHAKVVEPAEYGCPDTYVVEFDDGDRAIRVVNREAQSNPVAYCAEINRERGKRVGSAD